MAPEKDLHLSAPLSDERRRAIESLGADAYERLSYYERWIAAIAAYKRDQEADAPSHELVWSARKGPHRVNVHRDGCRYEVTVWSHGKAVADKAGLYVMDTLNEVFKKIVDDSDLRDFMAGAIASYEDAANG